jgi:4Fe-4S binding domain
MKKKISRLNQILFMILSGSVTLFFLLISKVLNSGSLFFTFRIGMDNFTPLLIAVLTTWSVFLTGKMVTTKKRASYRSFYWRLLSIIFFSQILVGVFISSNFLLSGELTIPHPSFFVFSGSHFSRFLSNALLLYFISLVLTGPSWCSHLCWLGSWDQYAASKKKRKISKSSIYLLRLLFFLFFVAVVLEFFKPNIKAVATLGFVYFIVSILVMAFVSGKYGSMEHCRSFCLIGKLSSIFAKISPFRMVKISTKPIPSSSCKMGAFDEKPSKNSKLVNCTLCGDCLDKYGKSDLKMRFFNFSFDAWPLFISLTIGLHSAFIALIVL